MEAHVPAVCEWIQQGDGHQLGEPGPDWSTSVSRHEQVSVFVAGTLSLDEEAAKVSGAIQHADCHVSGRQDCRINRIWTTLDTQLQRARRISRIPSIAEGCARTRTAFFR